MTESKRLFKIKIVANYSIFISQKDVKDWIMANVLNFSLCIFKKIIVRIFLFKNSLDVCVFPEKE